MDPQNFRDTVAIVLPNGKSINLDRNELTQLKDEVLAADKELTERIRAATFARNFSLF